MGFGSQLSTGTFTERGTRGGISLSGAKATRDLLNLLPKKLQKNVLTKASRKAVKSTMMQAKRNVKPVSPTIAKSIGVRQKTYSFAVSTVLGPRHGFATTKQIQGSNGPYSFYHDPVNTAHLVELGTAPHPVPKKKGNPAFLSENDEGFDVSFVGAVEHPGTKGLFFMERAWNQNKGDMFNVLAKTTEALIPPEVKVLLEV